MQVQYYLYLNDTNPQRYYWNAEDLKWSLVFSEATLFTSREHAGVEHVTADDHTTAEVGIGTIHI